MHQNIALTIRYDMPDEMWDRLVLVYENMPGWRGFTKEGIPVWSPDGPNSGEIAASVEPSGLCMSSTLESASWDAWIKKFMRLASDALGTPVVDAEGNEAEV